MTSAYEFPYLPDINQLKTISQSLAMLDAIICPKWEYRYFSFNAHWSSNEMMASMRNGSGDGYFILFTSIGAVLKGFAHEAPMAPQRSIPPDIWPGVIDSVPHEFATLLMEPAFVMEDTTFCMWRTYQDAAWQRGIIQFPHNADPDGSHALLAILDGTPQLYALHAETNFEQLVDHRVIEHIYNHQPLTEAFVAMLNPNLHLADISMDQEEIGYPYQHYIGITR